MEGSKMIQTQQDIFTLMTERHSVKQYDADYKMTREQVEQLLSAAHSAPSSWNLQHWKFFVIDDEQKKQELLPIAYGQKQVLDSSVTVAILGDLQANLNAQSVYEEAVAKGVLSEEIKERLIGQINGAYQFPQVARDEAVLNASLAAMQLMLAAKAVGLDTCPMGGFDRQGFVQHFAISERYIPVMLVVIGKAAKPAYASSRFPLSETVFWNEM
jgi:nitroreductase